MLRTNLKLAQRAIALQKQKDPTYHDFTRFIEGVANLWSIDPDDLFADEDGKEAPEIILNNMELNADLIGILGQALAERYNGFKHVFLYNVPLTEEEATLLVDILLPHRKLDEIVLSECKLSDDCINNLFKLNACTSSLDLSHNLFTAIDAAALCALKGRLDLSYNQLDSAFIKKLIELIKSNSLQLSYLDISGNKFTKEDIIELQKALKDTIIPCEMIVETSIAAQHKFEQKIMKSARHRKYDGFTGACSSHMVNRVIKSLISSVSLELSTINDNAAAQQIIDDTARAITVLTCKDRGLDQLNIGIGELGERGVEVISASFKKGAIIKSLCIERFTDEEEPLSVADLSQLLQACEGSCLLSLTIEDQLLTDKHAEIIASMLKKNPALQRLSIQNNSMTDIGINSIMQSLSSNNSLRELDLSGGSYTNTGTQAIMQMTETNCSLVIVKCDHLNENRRTLLKANMNRNVKIQNMPARDKANALRKIVNEHPNMSPDNRENILNRATFPSLQTLVIEEIAYREREAMLALNEKIARRERAERLTTLIQFTRDNCRAALTEDDVEIIIAGGGLAAIALNAWLSRAGYFSPGELLDHLKIKDTDDANGNNSQTLIILNRILEPNIPEKPAKQKDEAQEQLNQQTEFSKRLATLKEQLINAISATSDSRIHITGLSKQRRSLLNLLLFNQSSDFTADDFIKWRNAIEDDLKTVPVNFPYTAANGDGRAPLGDFNQLERDYYLNGLQTSLESMKRFQENQDNAKFFSTDKHEFVMPNFEVTEISLPKLQFLRESIKNLSDYCASIHDAKSKEIADSLTLQLNRIGRRTYTRDFIEATKNLQSIYDENINYLAQRRDNSLKHILVNVALALSIIGFIAQIINKVKTGNMFFFFDSETTRSKLAVIVNDAVRDLKNK